MFISRLFHQVIPTTIPSETASDLRDALNTPLGDAKITTLQDGLHHQLNSLGAWRL